MYILQYANNAKTTLAAPITGTQTTIAVSPGTGSLFPSPTTGQAFKITLVSASSASVYEICLCTARSGDTLTVQRAQEGTSGQPFILNDVVGNFDTKGTMDALVQADQLQQQYYQYGTATGTANALAVTIPSNLTSTPPGMYLTVLAAQANTGATTMTLTLGSTVVGTAPIVKGNNGTLIAGDIPAAGYPLQLNWSASYAAWVLANPATGIVVSSVPTGAIVNFPASVAPAGYLVCAGQLVSRTSYAALWAFAQASGNISASDAAWQVGQFSPGNGSTDFRLPQYGGYFMRSKDQGNGIDPGRSLGSAQGGQNASHNHSASASVSDPGHAHGVYDPGHAHSVYDPGHAHLASETPYGGYAAGGGAWRMTDFPSTNHTTSSSQTGIGINGSATGIGIYGNTTGVIVSVGVGAQGGSEARPINVSVLTCIKI